MLWTAKCFCLLLSNVLFNEFQCQSIVSLESYKVIIYGPIPPQPSGKMPILSHGSPSQFLRNPRTSLSGCCLKIHQRSVQYT